MQMKNIITYVTLVLSIVTLSLTSYFYFIEWQQEKAINQCVKLSILADNPDNLMKNFLACIHEI